MRRSSYTPHSQPLKQYAGEVPARLSRSLRSSLLIAYAGPFSADAGNGTVTHHVDVSLFPNWQGHDQVRRVTIEGGRLSISASDRTAADGRTFHSELTWLRV